MGSGPCTKNDSDNPKLALNMFSNKELADPLCNSVNRDLTLDRMEEDF